MQIRFMMTKPTTRVPGCGDDVDTLMDSDHEDDDVVMVQERRQP